MTKLPQLGEFKSNREGRHKWRKRGGGGGGERESTAEEEREKRERVRIFGAGEEERKSVPVSSEYPLSPSLPAVKFYVSLPPPPPPFGEMKKKRKPSKEIHRLGSSILP